VTWCILAASNNTINSTTKIYKKLSYRRETARQLPTWREGG